MIYIALFFALVWVALTMMGAPVIEDESTHPPQGEDPETHP